jgi:hypothetical protein
MWEILPMIHLKSIMETVPDHAFIASHMVGNVPSCVLTCNQPLCGTHVVLILPRSQFIHFRIFPVLLHNMLLV